MKMANRVCKKKVKIFYTEQTELTEIKKLKRNSQSLLALFFPVNLFGSGSSGL
jgi:hypothetical protein